MPQTRTNSAREIIDESDVFIDVHKAIRRMAPAPRARVPRGKVIADPTTVRKPSEQPLVDIEGDAQPNGTPQRKLSLPETSENGPRTSYLMRRRSSGTKGTMEPLRSDDPDVLQHLRHLGPSNAANRPKSTRINTVKIKPGNVGGVPDIPQTIPENARPTSSPSGVMTLDSHAPEGGVGEGLLASAGREASDGVHSVAVGYGTMAPSGDRMSWRSGRSGAKEAEDEPRSPKSTTNGNDYVVDHSRPVEYSLNHEEDADYHDENLKLEADSKPRSPSVSTIASLRSARSKSPPKRRHTARSGSISENVVDVNGIKKIVLETTSSSDSDDKVLLVVDADADADDAESSKNHSEAESANAGSKAGNKKKRKKRGKKKKGNGGDSSESQPLLGDT
jgi:metal transporter CNNM